MRAICIYDDILISLSEGRSESALTYLLVILAFRKLQCDIWDNHINQSSVTTTC